MNAPASETIGVSGAARLLGVSEGRVRQLAAAGTLPATVTPLGRLFNRRVVEALAEQRQREAVQRDAE
ncbi:MAG: helix-turn-helix domain-containing protein [Dehalococcoidia bacterium]